MLILVLPPMAGLCNRDELKARRLAGFGLLVLHIRTGLARFGQSYLLGSCFKLELSSTEHFSPLL